MYLLKECTVRLPNDNETITYSELTQKWYIIWRHCYHYDFGWVTIDRQTDDRRKRFKGNPDNANSFLFPQYCCFTISSFLISLRQLSFKQYLVC